MKNIKFFLPILFCLLVFSCQKDNTPPVNPTDPSAEMYFPPEAHNDWDNVLPSALDWNEAKLADLRAYLDSKKTRGFIILVNGKIVVEEYFKDHNINKNWNWYSAAKSLTSTMVAIAQDEGHLNINDKSSDYLGQGWSSLTTAQEEDILVKHHISMTTGLQNPIGNFNQWTCVTPSCFNYQAAPGTRWAYHQGAFTLTQDIITQATGLNFKQYGKQKIRDKIGMTGSWSQLLNVRIFSSSTRSMARFGLLALNEGVWDGETIYPMAYHNEMTNTSQNMNNAYGYLWWLNGKNNFLGTADQTLYPGSLIPNAPADMYAALGAQDQKIYVVPSKKMVVVRCGESAGNTEFATSSFDNELWGKINEVLP